MGLLTRTHQAELGHEGHAAKAEAILEQGTSISRGGVEGRQRDLLAANAHATLALYELLRGKGVIVTEP